MWPFTRPRPEPTGDLFYSFAEVTSVPQVGFVCQGCALLIRAATDHPRPEYAGS
jgi:hypothetical protein